MNALYLNAWAEIIILIVEGPALVFHLVRCILSSVYSFIVPAVYRMKEVHGETVLITGAGSGLGRMLAIKFARRGCCVITWDVNESANEETAAIIRESGGLIHTYTCDLSSRKDIYKAAERVKTEIGDVDILINNAGIVSGQKFLDTSDSSVERTMNVNIMAHFWTCKAFLPAMIEHNHGHIVTMASTAGLIGVCGLFDYHVSKFAAVGFDESLREELATMGRTGVHTTAVCPTFINTGMFDGVLTRLPMSLPILDAHYVTDKIMEAILTNQQVLIIPRLIYFIMALKWVLPTKAMHYLLRFTGACHFMDTFTGRDNKTSDNKNKRNK